jgi:hypothetical protein
LLCTGTASTRAVLSGQRLPGIEALRLRH